MKMNNKGVFSEPVALGWVIFAAINIIVSQQPGVKNLFRQDKAVKMCIENGQTEDVCVQTVASMSKEDILAFIKDDDLSQGNRGNFSEGYMN